MFPRVCIPFEVFSTQVYFFHTSPHIIEKLQVLLQPPHIFTHLKYFLHLFKTFSHLFFAGALRADRGSGRGRFHGADCRVRQDFSLGALAHDSVAQGQTCFGGGRRPKMIMTFHHAFCYEYCWREDEVHFKILQKSVRLLHTTLIKIIIVIIICITIAIKAFWSTEELVFLHLGV